MNTKQLELQQRIKLLMEYDMKKTLTENIRPILEQSGLLKLLSVADNVLDDIIKKGKLKTTSGTVVNSMDDLKNIYKRGSKTVLDDVSRTLLDTRLLKNPAISFKDKGALIKSFSESPEIISKYSNNTNQQIYNKFIKSGYPDDVAKEIANRLAKKSSTTKVTTTKGTTPNNTKPNNTFTFNKPKIVSDLKLAFPKASNKDIMNLVDNIRAGLPTSTREVDDLLNKAIRTYSPNYQQLLRDTSLKKSLWERYLSLPKKLQWGLLALGSLGSCNYIAPVFNVDCSTLAADLVNNLTSGAYNFVKKVKSPVNQQSTGGSQSSSNETPVPESTPEETW